MVTQRLPDEEPVSRLWTAFAIAWLLVLVVVVARLPAAGLSPVRLVASFAALALLTWSYVWLTVVRVPHIADRTAPYPSGRTEWTTLGALAGMAACVFVFTLLAPGQQIWWLMMYPIIAAGLVLPPAMAAAAIAALIAIGFLAAWLTDGRIDPIFLLQITFGGSALALRHLTATVAELRRAREELARAAVTEERLRFARDLHDLLGHSLSTIVLKSELARRLASREPHRAAAEIEDVERTARDALQQVRATVAGYRRASLKGEIAAARELLAAAGIEARIDGAVISLPPAADSLLGWAVREGVTNVVRHSHARSCTIRLVTREDCAVAEIVDDGSGPDADNGQRGCGLAGLSERAAADGGHVEAGPIVGGGFRLVVDVPVGPAVGARR